MGLAKVRVSDFSELAPYEERLTSRDNPNYDIAMNIEEMAENSDEAIMSYVTKILEGIYMVDERLDDFKRDLNNIDDYVKEDLIGKVRLLYLAARDTHGVSSGVTMADKSVLKNLDSIFQGYMPDRIRVRDLHDISRWQKDSLFYHIGPSPEEKSLESKIDDLYSNEIEDGILYRLKRGLSSIADYFRKRKNKIDPDLSEEAKNSGNYKRNTINKNGAGIDDVRHRLSVLRELEIFPKDGEGNMPELDELERSVRYHRKHMKKKLCDYLDSVIDAVYSGSGKLPERNIGINQQTRKHWNKEVWMTDMDMRSSLADSVTRAKTESYKRFKPDHFSWMQ